jgi:hypothetical protein
MVTEARRILVQSRTCKRDCETELADGGAEFDWFVGHFQARDWAVHKYSGWQSWAIFYK